MRLLMFIYMLTSKWLFILFFAKRIFENQ